MIVRQIKVAFYHNVKTGEWCNDPSKKYGNEYDDDLPISQYWSTAAYQKDSDDPTKSPNRKRFWHKEVHVFKKFTNNGKLSKTELRNLAEDEVAIFKPIAERKFAAEIAKEKMFERDRDKDTARALELKAIVDNANWENIQNKNLAVIKVKDSHSKWYSNVIGEMHVPSEYLTVVPVSVAKEAIELQKIRRKHQGDPKFNFWETSYKCREIRVADHDNQDNYSEIDPTYEKWEDIFNCDFLPYNL